MFCLFHKYDVIATSTGFHTTHHDLGNLKQPHFIAFKQCTRCGKRKLDFGRDAVQYKKSHGGILRAQIMWEQEGVLAASANKVKQGS